MWWLVIEQRTKQQTAPALRELIFQMLVSGGGNKHAKEVDYSIPEEVRVLWKEN